mmetsp:Transcript_105133/g.339075  ORF Transcript_105133/g.339075 Transcript_105133/m.339075 type:complete len:231 (-) Transcript_105133:61-753(-)
MRRSTMRRPSPLQLPPASWVRSRSSGSRQRRWSLRPSRRRSQWRQQQQRQPLLKQQGALQQQQRRRPKGRRRHRLRCVPPASSRGCRSAASIQPWATATAWRAASCAASNSGRAGASLCGCRTRRGPSTRSSWARPRVPAAPARSCWRAAPCGWRAGSCCGSGLRTSDTRRRASATSSASAGRPRACASPRRRRRSCRPRSPCRWSTSCGRPPPARPRPPAPQAWAPHPS